MRLLFDENLSPRFVAALASSFPDSAHVTTVGLQGRPDQEIWNFAKDQGMAIVSKDADFGAMSVLHGHPPKVVVLRIGNSSTGDVERLIIEFAPILQSFDADENSSLIELLAR